MDIFAHGLWAAAMASGLKRIPGVRIRSAWTAWWGVFPDLFAFTLPVTQELYLRLAGVYSYEQAGHRGAPHHAEWVWQLYQISHSLVVFALVFGLAALVARRPAAELLGWLLHILIDIPSHSLLFFPTPFLWPVSSFQFDGVSWANRRFMLSNYSALALAYFALWRSGRKPRRPDWHGPRVV
jgi:hypothetical protein